MSPNNNRNSGRNRQTPSGQQRTTPIERHEATVLETLASISAQLSELQDQVNAAGLHTRTAASAQSEDNDTDSEISEDMSASHSRASSPPALRQRATPQPQRSARSQQRAAITPEMLSEILSSITLVGPRGNGSTEEHVGSCCSETRETHGTHGAHGTSAAPPVYTTTSVFTPPPVSSNTPSTPTALLPATERRSSHRRYYVVTRGLEVGVFCDSWDTVAPLVIGVPGAVWWRASSRAEANEHYARAVAEGRVTILT